MTIESDPNSLESTGFVNGSPEIGKSIPIGKAIPVEMIISDIKERDESWRENFDYRKHDSKPNNFWRYYSKYLVSWEAIKKNVRGYGEHGDLLFEDNSPDFFSHENFNHKSTNSPEQNAGHSLFKDQIIVDLCAGASESGYVNAQLLDGKAYIGVDLYYSDSLKTEIEKLDTKQTDPDDFDMNYVKSIPGIYKHRIPFAIESADILSFLKRLPDNSVSIMMGGAGGEIIDDHQYRSEVYAEIKRVLHPAGGFLTLQSDITTQDFEDGLDVVYSREDLGIYIMKKKSV